MSRPLHTQPGGFFRRAAQAALRRLEVDGVYLTPAQALALYKMTGRLAAREGISTDEREREVVIRLGRRVAELQRGGSL